jgi:DNA-binding IclR family transcriptional regulator
MGNTTGGEPSIVQAVDRAVSVLMMLARMGEAGVTEIAGELGVHKSTAFRLLATLESRGLAEQNATRGKYRLGFGVVNLASAVTASLDLNRVSRSVCEVLARDVGETVNLAIHDGDSVVNVDQVMGSSAVTTVNWVGRRNPLHATSSGKVFLAHLPAEELDGHLAQPLPRFTPNTVTNPDDLRRLLGAVRTNGYAFTEEELEVGLNAVAAPILSLEGSVVAALSASGPAYRLTPERLADVARQTVLAAATISERLGYRRIASKSAV